MSSLSAAIIIANNYSNARYNSESSPGTNTHINTDFNQPNKIIPNDKSIDDIKVDNHIRHFARLFEFMN